MIPEVIAGVMLAAVIYLWGRSDGKEVGKEFYLHEQNLRVAAEIHRDKLNREVMRLEEIIVLKQKQIEFLQAKEAV